jgi:outer membrane protein OmpA-like peptidoglycan-associated protein
MLDEEPESPVGAAVDTRGIVLDSDGDGVADYMDQEPYSPPGYEITENGVALVPEIPSWSEEDIRNIADQRVAAGISACCRDWFLPMIHFDLDSYCIKPEYYPHLHHVGTVMQDNPDIMVTVRGHTDYRNNNEYNMVLSYNRAKAAIDFMTTKYGLSRDRFKLMYGGEENPLITKKETRKLKEKQQYLNRRVEFSVSKNSDYDMPRPEGPEAGHCDEYKPSGDVYAPAPSSPVYRGNKNAGF